MITADVVVVICNYTIWITLRFEIKNIVHKILRINNKVEKDASVMFIFHVRVNAVVPENKILPTTLAPLHKNMISAYFL